MKKLYRYMKLAIEASVVYWMIEEFWTVNKAVLWQRLEELEAEVNAPRQCGCGSLNCDVICSRVEDDEDIHRNFDYE